MYSLSILDIILIAVYFVVLLLIGYFTSRKQKEEDYLIAERKLGPWSTMATMNASKTGSILMIFVALTFLWGFSAIWYFIGVIAGALLFIPFAMKLKEEAQGRYYTLADYFKHNYGNKVAFLASVVSILLMVGLAVLNIIAGAKIFAFFTGWPFIVCVILMTFIILLYLLLGGFKAVVKTDIFQYIAMVFLMLLMALLLFNGSIIPSSDWNLFSTNIATVIGFFLVGVMFPFASPDMWQRVYSSKGKKELKNGILLSVGIYAIFAFLLALIALTIKAKFPSVDPDMALIHGFANLLPAGLVGLAIILLFSAIMSSVDTYIFTASSSAIQDFFHGEKKRIVSLIRKALFVFTLLGAVIAIAIQNLVISGYIFAAFYSIIAIPTIATWIRKKIKPLSLILGFLFGLIITVLLLIFSLSKGEISPSIVLIAIASTIVGLLLGGLINKFKKFPA